ncbi:MAG: peptidase T, partial [Planctomycetales bacterium]|nr:peptidase T [Planctomycetales bacterium]
MNRDRLLQSFLRYVRVDTTAGEPGGAYPSSPGQLELGAMLRDELAALGAADVAQDEHGLVYATIPATVDRPTPVVALNSHVDTSPETTGKNVQPQVIASYAGGDIALAGDPSQVIRVSENPELNDLLGATLVTTDGTTLLGGDDKGGVSVIMELAAHLLEHPEIPHGPIRILFTCDEEIGHGVDHVELEKLGADVCYTLDGAGANDIDTETFSADLAVVTVRGVNIHPSIAKGRMVNALRAAGAFLARLPADTLAPEVADGREGFIHPCFVDGMVAHAEIQLILRDFETEQLARQAALLRDVAAGVMRDVPGCRIDVAIKKQYRNMREGLLREPRAVDYAVRAHQRLGREPRLTIVRGGTDGSQLTERGLPTPNLSCGQHNPHS